MRLAIVLLATLVAVPAVALAGRSTATLQVGVTVVEACPPGSGKPCAEPADPRTGALQAGAPADPPITVLQDDARRTITVVY